MLVDTCPKKFVAEEIPRYARIIDIFQTPGLRRGSIRPGIRKKQCGKAFLGAPLPDSRKKRD